MSAISGGGGIDCFTNVSIGTDTSFPRFMPVDIAVSHVAINISFVALIAVGCLFVYIVIM